MPIPHQDDAFHPRVDQRSSQGDVCSGRASTGNPEYFQECSHPGVEFNIMRIIHAVAVIASYPAVG